MKRSLFTLIIACLLVFSCLFSVFAFADAAEDAAEEAASMRRIDGDGYLYYMDYTGDYYSSEVIDSLRRVGYIDPGCSTFFTHNLDGEPISCRNYDIRHSVSPEDPTLTGLNFVLHCKPEGKYESVALADAIWCAPNDPLYRAGGPDLEGFDSTLLDILPYQCMDGLNEKGLFVSIMRVNIKEGDQPGRFGVAASMLVRYMLDDCADVEEAIAKIDTAIVTPEDWQECHIFVSDAQDHYALIESRNSVVSVIDTDVVTNFYLGSDDMEDYYRNGVLREEPVAMIDKNGKPLYHFGYGHGYHRFVTIASQLDRFRKDGRTMMPEASALVILRSAVQSPYTEVTGTSMTQYSAIYNNAEKTVSIWPFQNYETEYKFDISGKQMTASAEEPVENHGADSERIGIIGAMDIEVNTLKEAAGLAGWSPNSEVLASLVQFVSESVDESHEGYIPPEDRIAVFDFDGTLYGERFPTSFNLWFNGWRALHCEDYDAPERLKVYAAQKEAELLYGTEFRILDTDAQMLFNGYGLFEGLRSTRRWSVVSRRCLSGGLRV